MTLAITAIYTCALAVLAIWLSARVSILRAKTGVAIMHGDNDQLAERIRQHANLTEYVPLALILMGIVEMNGASSIWLHAIGAMLLIGRLVHPFGIKYDNTREPARAIGSSLTTISTLTAVVYLVWSYLG